jgi:hypothetical protein
VKDINIRDDLFEMSLISFCCQENKLFKILLATSLPTETDALIKMHPSKGPRTEVRMAYRALIWPCTDTHWLVACGPRTSLDVMLKRNFHHEKLLPLKRIWISQMSVLLRIFIF